MGSKKHTDSKIFWPYITTSARILLAKASHAARLTSKEARKCSPCSCQEEGRWKYLLKGRNDYHRPHVYRAQHEESDSSRPSEAASRRRVAGTGTGTPPPEPNAMQLLPCANSHVLAFSSSQPYIPSPHLSQRAHSTCQLGDSPRCGVRWEGRGAWRGGFDSGQPEVSPTLE